MIAPDVQCVHETQSRTGSGATFSEQPNAASNATSRTAAPSSREPSNEQAFAARPPAVSDISQAPPIMGSEPSTGTAVPEFQGLSNEASEAKWFAVAPDLSGFHELRIWAESFEDAQRARISCTNRMERGGVPPELFAAQLTALNAAEHQVKLGMVRCYRRVVPAGVREWQLGVFGIGEHLLGRLLGALGHPRVATPYHWEGEGDQRKLIPDLVFERTVRQLWSYCGHGDAERKRRKGMTAEEAFMLGSPRCKMLTHLLAEATIKCRVEPNLVASTRTRSDDPATFPDQSNAVPVPNDRTAGRDSSTEPTELPVARDDPVPSADQPMSVATAIRAAADRRYRSVYDQRRAFTKDTHADWSDGHSHNDALRIVGKHILADLWEASDEAKEGSS